MTSSVRLQVSAIVVAVALVGLAACSSSKKGASGTTGSSSSAPAVTTTTEPRPAGPAADLSKELSDPAGYASVIAADVQGVRTYMTLTSQAGVGVRASDGKLMWRYPRVANSTANIATPIFFDNKVFYTSNYDTGAALLGLTARNGEVQAQEIYFTRDMQNHHGGVVLVNGYLYGFSSSILTCLEFATGKLMWRNRSVGKGSLTYADGHLICYGETKGSVVLVEATPSGWNESGRFSLPKDSQLRVPAGRFWTHPVIANGKLYIRDKVGREELYDIIADPAESKDLAGTREAQPLLAQFRRMMAQIDENAMKWHQH